MKKKRMAEGYGKYSKYDNFEVDLSPSWLGLWIFMLLIGLFIILPNRPIPGVIWVAVVSFYLYKKLKAAIKNKIRESREVVEEEEIPYHIRLQMESERKQAQEKATQDRQPD